MHKFNLKCVEWLNMNKDARDLKKLKNNSNKKAKNKNNDLGAVYLLKIAGFSSPTCNIDLNNNKSNPNYLACLSSDQIINVYDHNLKLNSKLTNTHSTANSYSINEIGFFKNTNQMLFSCADDGTLKCWDLRSDNSDSAKAAICFDYCKDSRELLCADINSDDSLLGVGTNKTVDDALIYLYDIRFHSKYLHKLCESHSADLSQIKFEPSNRNKFSSASFDGLVCLYDLAQGEQQPTSERNENVNEEKDENDSDSEEDDDDEEDPDFMEQVFNTESLVQKIGYLSSKNGQTDQIFAITYTNDLFVWDLNSHDLILKKKSIKNDELVENEYLYVDCFYLNSSLTICMSDKRGNVKLVQNDVDVFETRRETVDRTHKELVRSTFWNGEHLFSAGEDGFLIKWTIDESTGRYGEVERKKRDRSRSDQESDHERSEKRHENNDHFNKKKKPFKV